MANNEETEQRRRFRARPLRVDDPVPVFYFDSKKLKQEQEELYEWLLSTDGQVEGQVQVVDVESRPVVAETWKHFNKNGAAPSIGVPGWQCLSSEDGGSESSSDGDGDSSDEGPSSEDSHESPYHRWVQRMPEDMMSKKEYVVDDDDDDWLQGKEMEEDLFESIMDSFEKQHYQRLLSDRSRMYTESASGRFGLKIPEASVVLPLEKAVEDLKTFDQKDVELVHSYWVEKRGKAEKPLLDRFMDEFPWSVILDHQRQLRPERVNVEGPFVGVATPDKVNQAPPKVKQRQMSVDDELHRLYGIREDLERARTLADQVRKREKLKKHLHDTRVERLQLQMDQMRPTFTSPPASVADCKEESSPLTDRIKKGSQSGANQPPESSKRSKASETREQPEISKRVTRSETKEPEITKRVTRSGASSGKCTPQTRSETRISRSKSTKSGPPKPSDADGSDNEASVKTGRKKSNRGVVKNKKKGVKRTRTSEAHPDGGDGVEEEKNPLEKSANKRKTKKDSAPVDAEAKDSPSVRVTRSAAQSEKNRRGKGGGGVKTRTQPLRKSVKNIDATKKRNAGGRRGNEGVSRGKAKEEQANTRNNAKRARKK
ncbi:hypothetical protein BSKO_04157 [Bryopsis sp. KO-2023]|nr:hypothetical protein BSKO_04157 [Bryopsis sp. KO-2023]